jgi:antitoxin ParD1/3/4
MNVSLTPELESLVTNKVKTGLYNSASEVVREALRLLEEQDRIKTMRQEVMLGLNEIRSGNYIELRSDDELREFGEGIIRDGRANLESERRAK